MTMFLNVSVEPGGADKRFAADVAGAEPRIAQVDHVLTVPIMTNRSSELLTEAMYLSSLLTIYIY